MVLAGKVGAAALGGTDGTAAPDGAADPVGTAPARDSFRATSAWPLAAGALPITVLIGTVLVGTVLAETELLGIGRPNTDRGTAPAVISGCSLLRGARRAEVTGMAGADTADSSGTRWSVTGCRDGILDDRDVDRGWADPDCANPDSGRVGLRGVDAIATMSMP